MPNVAVRLAALGLAATAFAGGAAQAGATTPAQNVTALRNLINATRAQHGLVPVRPSRQLDRSALLKTEEIRHCNSFSHTPCGTPFSRSFQAVGYFRGAARVGENLYWGSGALAGPDKVMAAWLASPRHRAILLGAGWREAGLGVVHAPRLFGAGDVWVWALQLGRRR